MTRRNLLYSRIKLNYLSIVGQKVKRHISPQIPIPDQPALGHFDIIPENHEIVLSLRLFQQPDILSEDGATSCTELTAADSGH